MEFVVFSFVVVDTRIKIFKLGKLRKEEEKKNAPSRPIFAIFKIVRIRKGKRTGQLI